jgi:hypothetical protein
MALTLCRKSLAQLGLLREASGAKIVDSEPHTHPHRCHRESYQHTRHAASRSPPPTRLRRRAPRPHRPHRPRTNRVPNSTLHPRTHLLGLLHPNLPRWRLLPIRPPPNPRRRPTNRRSHSQKIRSPASAFRWPESSRSSASPPAACCGPNSARDTAKARANNRCSPRCSTNFGPANCCWAMPASATADRLRPGPDRERVWRHVLQVMGSEIVDVRPNRVEPQVLKRRPKDCKSITKPREEYPRKTDTNAYVSAIQPCK